jgi:hypothetical protein
MKIAWEFGFTPASRSRIFSFTQKTRCCWMPWTSLMMEVRDGFAEWQVMEQHGIPLARQWSFGRRR